MSGNDVNALFLLFYLPVNYLCAVNSLPSFICKITVFPHQIYLKCHNLQKML